MLSGSRSHSEKLKENALSVRISRGLGQWQRGRLFIVWVCLQIYCSDTSLLFLFFPSVNAWKRSRENKVLSPSLKVSEDHI